MGAAIESIQVKGTGTFKSRVVSSSFVTDFENRSMNANKINVLAKKNEKNLIALFERVTG